MGGRPRISPSKSRRRNLNESTAGEYSNRSNVSPLTYDKLYYQVQIDNAYEIFLFTALVLGFVMGVIFLI